MKVGDKVKFVQAMGDASRFAVQEGDLVPHDVYTVKSARMESDSDGEIEFISVEGVIGTFFASCFMLAE
jgi:hypothetical protein